MAGLLFSDTLQVPQIKHSGVLSTDGRFESIIGSDILGPGLRTDIGEYDSFLNVIVQVSVSLNELLPRYPNQVLFAMHLVCSKTFL